MSASVLNQRVLLLNKLWTAVGVASLQRAIILLWSTYNDGMPKAKIIAAPGGDVVIDPTEEFATYTWKDWDRMEPQDGESVVRSGNTRSRRTRSTSMCWPISPKTISRSLGFR